MRVEPSQQEAVLRHLEKAGAPVSEADVAAATGLDLGTAKMALYDLMRAYTCALDVREDGTLVYDFGRRLERLGKPTFKERLKTVGRYLWKGFSFVYKASLAVVLVAYALTFVLLILAFAIAASFAAEDGAPAEGAFHLVAAVFRAIFEFNTAQALVYADTDRYGYNYRHYEPKPPVFPAAKKKAQEDPKEHRKSFIASVYDFVLGPPRVPVDERAQHKEAAAFVRKHGGLLTVADVQALSGMSRDEAERFFAAFVAENDGEVEISDDGALYARFPELLRSASAEHDAPILHYWDEYEPPHELTGNTGKKNLTIALLALFNLACAAFVTFGLPHIDTATVWLGAVPFALFSSFFAIPLLRAPLVWWRNRQQHAHNIRKRLFKAIFGKAFEERAAAVSFQELVAKANRDAVTEETLDADALKGLLEETLRQVGGSLDTDTQAQLVMNLERLKREAEARDEHAMTVEEAEVVYSTR